MSEKAQLRNPLLDWGEVQHIAGWKHWRKLWDGVNLVEFRHSLLHFGFSVPCDNYQEQLDRICFYLTVADGHAQSEYLETPSEKQTGVPLEFSAFDNHPSALGYFGHRAELRQKIARKAFEVLCLNFFRNPRDINNARPPTWTEDVFQDKVWSALSWFMRVEDKHLVNGIEWIIMGIGACRNKVIQDNHLKIFREFAFKFCKFTWKRSGSHRAHLIQILEALGKIDILLDEDAYPMNEESLLMLKELTMECNWHIPDGYGKSDYRKPKNLIEAVASKSPVARVYHTLLTSSRVKRRAQRVIQLQQRRRELEMQLAQLK